MQIHIFVTEKTSFSEDLQKYVMTLFLKELGNHLSTPDK